jgi:hypothetical protein
MTDDRPGRMPLAMLATSLDRALYAGRPARIATHSESKRRAGRYRHPILLLITSLIDTNRSMGAEAGLPPRFAGRIPHPAEAGVRCNIVHAGRGACLHAIGMFIVTEADAAAIRAVFDQEGELSAAIELRRRYPGITDNAKARATLGASPGGRRCQSSRAR